jgi:hypothetical protein
MIDVPRRLELRPEQRGFNHDHRRRLIFSGDLWTERPISKTWRDEPGRNRMMSGEDDRQGQHAEHRHHMTHDLHHEHQAQMAMAQEIISTG